MWRRQTAHAANLDVLGPARSERRADQGFWKVDLRDPNRYLSTLERVEKACTDGLETIMGEKMLRKLLLRFHSDSRILTVMKMVAEISIFSGCTVDEVMLVVECLGVIMYKYCETVVGEGERGDCMVIVSDGMLLARSAVCVVDRHVKRALESIHDGTDVEDILGSAAEHSPIRLSQAEQTTLSKMLIREGHYWGEQSLLEAHHHTNPCSLETYGSKFDEPGAECLVLHADMFQRLPLHLVDKVRLNILRQELRKDSAGDSGAARATNMSGVGNRERPLVQPVRRAHLMVSAEHQAAKIARSVSRRLVTAGNYPDRAVPRLTSEGNRTVHNHHKLKEMLGDRSMLEELRAEYAQNHANPMASEQRQDSDEEEDGEGDDEEDDDCGDEGDSDDSEEFPLLSSPPKDKLSSDSALLQRESLKFEPAILRLLNCLWTAVDADGSGAVEKTEYVMWMRKMCYLLIGETGHDDDYHYEQVRAKTNSGIEHAEHAHLMAVQNFAAHSAHRRRLAERYQRP
jgi:hypothetical protein